MVYFIINRLKNENKIQQYEIKLHDNFIMKKVNYTRRIFQTRLLDIPINFLEISGI